MLLFALVLKEAYYIHVIWGEGGGGELLLLLVGGFFVCLFFCFLFFCCWFFVFWFFVCLFCFVFVVGFFVGFLFLFLFCVVVLGGGFAFFFWWCFFLFLFCCCCCWEFFANLTYHFLKITCSLGLSKLSQVKEEEKRKTKLWMTGSGFSPSILPPPPPSLYVCLYVCSSSLPTVPVPHFTFRRGELGSWLVSY